MKLPVIVTTSDNYHHCLPIFFKQYNKFWGDPFTLLGYKQPPDLPDNCTFISMGKQRGPAFFSNDLAYQFQRLFQSSGRWAVWLFEDSFIKSFNRKIYDWIQYYQQPMIGRINLTTEGMRREHTIDGALYFVPKIDPYRLSTQPSIWNLEFLLRYMKPGLNPWQFETQKTADDYGIIGPVTPVLTHNEGTTKKNIHKLNLDGIEL